MTRRSLAAAVSFVALGTALAASGAARAQTETPGEDTPEVVVTAAPFVISLDSVITGVDVIRRDDLDTRRAGGLGEAVADLPGVRSSFFGPGASRPVIRGLAGPRVQVLTNGVGMIDASALSPDHAVAEDPAEASRIEVLRGPAALVYGGSAIGGVVNVIDERIPTSPARDGFEGRVSIQGSSVDDGYQAAASIKAGSGPLVFTLDGVRRETEDYRVPVPPESRRLAELEGEEPEDADRVENTFSRLTQYGAGVGFLGERLSFGLSAKRTETRYGVPGHHHHHDDHDHDHDDDDDHHHHVVHGPDDHDHDHDEDVSIDLKQTRYDLRGAFQIGGAAFSSLRFNLGWADYEHTEFEGDEVGTVFSSKGFESRFDLLQVERDGWNGAVGVQHLRRDFDAVGAEAYVPASKVRETAVFTQQRLDTGPWGVEGGLRLERRDLETALGDRDFTNVSASVGAFVRPADGLFLGAALSRNVRAPNEAELFAEGPHIAIQAYEIGDDDLKSEVAWTAEFTTHLTRGRFAFDGHVFWTEFDGFIDLRPTGDEEDDLPVFAYSQTDARFYGFEAEARMDLWRDGARSLTFGAGYDWVRGSTDLGNPARIPPPSATARLTWASPLFTLRGEVRRMAAQNRVAEFELPTDGYTMVNLFGAVRPTQDPRFTVFAEVRNLGDVEAREHVSFLKDLAPLPGRNVRAGIAYRF